MRSRRTLGMLLFGAAALVLAGPAVVRLVAQTVTPAAAGAGQDQAPNRRDFEISASAFKFSPDRLEVTQDDLVKLTVRSADVPYSFTIDEYRVSKRVPGGGAVTFEFRADRAGTFPFYSNLTSDARHREARGELVVRPR